MIWLADSGDTARPQAGIQASCQSEQFVIPTDFSQTNNETFSFFGFPQMIDLVYDQGNRRWDFPTFASDPADEVEEPFCEPF